MVIILLNTLKSLPDFFSKKQVLTIFKIFIYFVAALGLYYCTRALSLVVASRGYSLFGERASHCNGFPSRRAQTVGTWTQQLRLERSRAQAQ